MVLIDLLLKERKNLDLKLYVLHYNHNWRKESLKDYELIKRYCKKNKLNLIYQEDTGKIEKDEENARNKRYSFFLETAKKYSLEYICTAHHKDDFLETVLFRMARGTGPKGLMPIKEVYNLENKIKVFRPMLSFSKDQIRIYAGKNKITFNEDVTNNDISYKRNFIRKELIPLLKTINPKAGENILALSDLCFSQNLVLEKYLNDIFLKLKKSIEKNDFVKFDKRLFMRMDQQEQKLFIYWYLSKINLIGNFSKIDFILDAISRQETITLNKNLYLKTTSSDIIFDFHDDKSKQETNIFKKKIDLGKSKNEILLPDNKKIIIEKYKYKSFNKKFPKDAEKLALCDFSTLDCNNLTLRYRNSYDVFQPLGLSKNIKLKKYLINKKISQKERYNLPLLCVGNEVLWLPGYSLSEKLKVKIKPTHILKLI